MNLVCTCYVRIAVIPSSLAFVTETERNADFTIAVNNTDNIHIRGKEELH